MHDDFYLPQSSWIALLSIAHRYDFQDAFNRAIREIYDSPERKTTKGQRRMSDSELGYPVFLILIAKQYDVPLRHVAPYIVALVMREEALTEVEVMRLPPLTVSQLGRAREDYLRKTAAWRSQTLESTRIHERSPSRKRSSTHEWGSSGSPGIVAMEIVRKIWLEVEK